MGHCQLPYPEVVSYTENSDGTITLLKFYKCNKYIIGGTFRLYLKKIWRQEKQFYVAAGSNM